MPELRPFRALRYDATAGDLRDLVSPPYDVISPVQQRVLARRHPHNVVRLDLPLDEPGDQPDDRYRRAARDLAAWRSDGTLRKDRQLSVYAYEQSYVLPGSTERRVQRGFFARLRLEDFGPDSGVVPHERTLSGPKEDRYRLLRATGINASTVVVLAPDRSGSGARTLESVARVEPDVDVTDDEGVRHRLWQLPTDDPDRGQLAEALLRSGSEDAVTIADGHHRYETALRYHDERHRDRARCELAPFDYILALVLPAGQPLTVLPTHRVVRDGIGGEELLAAASTLFDVERLPTREELLSAFAIDREPAASTPSARPDAPPTRPDAPSARPDAQSLPADRPHRIGLWTGGVAAILHVRPTAFEPFLDPAASPTLRWLDVNLLAVALDRLLGVDRAATTGGGRIVYTKDANEALDTVDAGGAVSAFLLDPTRVSDVVDIAAAGEVMPQKSTYFHPKPVTGLVLNPHEW